MADCGQVKEVVKSECAVCRQVRDISFYSYSVCCSCHACPECGTAAEECFQTEPYICVATKERLTAVWCIKCDAQWRTRLELDREVIYKGHTEAAPVCRVCGKDVHFSYKSAWSKKGADQPCLCRECLECPTCKTGAHFEKLPDGTIQCEVCKANWSTARDFESSFAQSSLL